MDICGEAFDHRAAEKLQEMGMDFRRGPFFTGNNLKQKGYVVYETRRIASDTISRYTDRYLSTQKIGNTAQNFSFVPEHFPPELRKALGVEPESGNFVKQEQPASDRLASVTERAERAAETNEEEEASGAESVDEGDEFEELEDDDYNAEKYFDDGDDDMGDDDVVEEAAY